MFLFTYHGVNLPCWQYPKSIYQKNGHFLCHQDRSSDESSRFVMPYRDELSRSGLTFMTLIVNTPNQPTSTLKSINNPVTGRGSG